MLHENNLPHTLDLDDDDFDYDACEIFEDRLKQNLCPTLDDPEGPGVHSPLRGELLRPRAGNRHVTRSVLTHDCHQAAEILCHYYSRCDVRRDRATER